MAAFNQAFCLVMELRAAMETRVRVAVLYNDGTYSAEQIQKTFGVPQRTLRRWVTAYRQHGLDGLSLKKTGPKKSPKKIPVALERRILRLKKKYPNWGAGRLKNQFGLPCSERTVHRTLKSHGLLVRIKPKPQPCKRFARHHVDSMWQGDTFQFRIKRVGKVYVTGFTDDCSRYRVRSKVYLDKSAKSSTNCLDWALCKGRIPREIYLDNGKQFTAEEFRSRAKKRGVRLIFGKPGHPRGRGKIGAYHKALYRELIVLKRFRSLSHFRKELRRFDSQYNNWRKQEVLGWQTPASVYQNPKFFNKKQRKKISKKRPQTMAGKRP